MLLGHSLPAVSLWTRRSGNVPLALQRPLVAKPRRGAAAAPRAAQGSAPGAQRAEQPEGSPNTRCSTFPLQQVADELPSCATYVYRIFVPFFLLLFHRAF